MKAGADAMTTPTILRIIGACALFGVLWLAGAYNIGGVSLLVMTIGFVFAFERLAVRAAKTDPRKGTVLAGVILVALGIIAAMNVPASAMRQSAPAIASSHAGNYPECLLENLPGVQNDTAARAAQRICTSKYPGGLASVKQGAGRGARGAFASGDECVVAVAGETQSEIAARAIGLACRRLFDEPIDWSYDPNYDPKDVPRTPSGEIDFQKAFSDPNFGRKNEN